MNFRFYQYWQNPSKKQWLYIFWFSEREFIDPFVEHFNKLYETRLHSMTPGEEMEMADESTLDALGVDPDKMEQGWFVEIIGPKLDDTNFEDLAVIYGGEYDGMSEI